MKHNIEILNLTVRGCIAVLLFGFLATAAGQQPSDYQVVKSFQSKYNAIREAIREAKTSKDCDQISTRLLNLEEEFAADTTLLNKALYPRNYDAEVASARNDLRLTRERLGLIESQGSKIAGIEQQVAALAEKVDSIARENTRLMASLDVMAGALKNNKRVVDSLNKIISRLTVGLRSRDAAIFALVDSMFAQYSSNLGGLPEGQKRTLVARVERCNVVAAIREAAEQNLRFLRTTPLPPKDLIQMLKDQQKFSSYWKGIGPRLAALYLNRRDRERRIDEVNTLVAKWGNVADSSLWANLYGVFTDNKVAVRPFSNADEFVASLSEFFDTQGGDSSAPSSEKTSRLHHFLNAVWNPSVGTQWLPLMAAEGIITSDQRTQLQSKLDAWEASARPTHVVIYAIVIVVLALLVLFLFFWRKQRRAGILQEPSQN